MAETNLTVFSNGSGDTESLETDTDSGSSVSSLGAALLDCDSSAYSVSPLCVFERDRLGFFDDLVRINALSIANFFAFVDGRNAVLSENSEDLRLTSLVTFKFCHVLLPPYCFLGSI